MIASGPSLPNYLRKRMLACCQHVRLCECYADAMHEAPHDPAVMDNVVACNHKFERFRYAKRAFDFEAGTRWRQIAHHATDPSGTIELNRASLEYPMSRSAPAFVHGNRAARE